MGQWIIHLDAAGMFAAWNNVYDETTAYGPYTLEGEVAQELWTLISTANIEKLPRTFERPGVPDETAYSFCALQRG